MQVDDMASLPQDRNFHEFVQQLGEQDIAWYIKMQHMIDDTEPVHDLHEALAPMLPLMSVAEEGCGMSEEELKQVVDGTLQIMRDKLLELGIQGKFSEHYAGAINIYTQAHVRWFRFMSRHLNDTKQRCNHGNISEPVLACRKYLKLLMAALPAMPSRFISKERTFRGVAWVYPEPTRPLTAEYFYKGRRAYFFTMRSFSRNETEAQKFANEKGRDQAATMFHMGEGAVGYSISEFSAIPEEEEVLYPFLSEVEVEGVALDESDGRPLHHVHLRQVLRHRAQPVKAEEVEAFAARRTDLSLSDLAYFFRHGAPSPTTADKRAVASAELVNQAFDALVGAVEPQIRGKTALFLVGATGAGKSTLACWLGGSPVRIEYGSPANQAAGGEGSGSGGRLGGARARLCGPSVQRGPPRLCVALGGEEEFPIGQESTTSKTFLPKAKAMDIEGETVVLVDMPGFGDTAGIEIQIAVDLALRHLVNQAGESLVLALVDIASVAAERGAPLRTLLKKLLRHFPKTEKGFQFRVGVTKCDETFAANKEGEWMNSFVQVLDECCPGMADADDVVININRELYSQTISPSAFLSTWRRPEQGSQPVQSPLDSDCLDPNIELFAREFLHPGFHAFLLRSFIGDAAWQEKLGGESDDNDDALKRAKLYLEALDAYAKQMREASYALVHHQKLSIQRQVPAIDKLLDTKQPRLVLCFLDAEEEFLIEQQKLQLKNFLMIQVAIEDVRKRDSMTKGHVTELKTKADRVAEQLQAIASNHGYQDLAIMIGPDEGKNFMELPRNIGAATVSLNVLGAIALVLATAPGAAVAVPLWLTYSVWGGYTVTGLTTMWAKSQQRHSENVKDTLSQMLDALLQTIDALHSQKTRLDAEKERARKKRLVC
mmetsp:Transcript_42280/g.106551  ORF Transcript_42280/g.106551 Transcript_42280/m.106551 type:complete len:886 (+) Transcript_42280:53-2710(+)|eukprot:CAMPEP_0115209128 /NCGR_PEP_ID=MMETSP0270-20121206/21578_1 /TAXON_ID=71861 /ORGANISM="Scrippsiella trochoidea, Strain CCMP3099" /LENGTH=885 /DNA_ID=CAMNT_0002622755 /DNA_START=50 /DNA_END=2707 /DNA_ORIENTATION=+